MVAILRRTGNRWVTITIIIIIIIIPQVVKIPGVKNYYYYYYYIYYGERQSAHLSLHDVVLEVSGQAVDKREDSDEQDV